MHFHEMEVGEKSKRMVLVTIITFELYVSSKSLSEVSYSRGHTATHQYLFRSRLLIILRFECGTFESLVQIFNQCVYCSHICWPQKAEKIVPGQPAPALYC